MTFQQEKHCFIACSEDKVNAGLCDCINSIKNEALRQPCYVPLNFQIKMDLNLFLKTIENFNELQIEVLYQDITYKATDYNITEMLFALEPLVPINSDVNRLWVRAENCKLLHF